VEARPHPPNLEKETNAVETEWQFSPADLRPEVLMEPSVFPALFLSTPLFRGFGDNPIEDN